ncbi:MAG TPA: ATP synthase subunit I [Nevskiaceae bacterium]|nr:ATP synthase subunit I [Nevskiaceae bacterium]
MSRGVVKLLAAQVVLALVAMLLMYLLRDHRLSAGGAALYGGAIAWFNALILAWSTSRAGRAAATTKVGDMRIAGFGLIAGVVGRFVFTLAAFAVGVALLRLDPPSLIVGFALPQLAFVVARDRGTPAQCDKV